MDDDQRNRPGQKGSEVLSLAEFRARYRSSPSSTPLNANGSPVEENQRSLIRDLFIAVAGNDPIDVLLIWEKGVDGINVNTREENGLTLLHCAAAIGCMKMCSFLLNNGAKINDKDKKNGATPLHFAAKNGHTEVCKLLLNNGAKINDRDKNGKTPLHYAAENGRKKTCKLLSTNMGAEINGKDKDGWTALHYAAGSNQKSTVIGLVANGADIEAVDDTGRTPFFCAIVSGHEETARSLLMMRADIEKGNEKCQTPLVFAAVLVGDKRMIDFLIKNGADVGPAINAAKKKGCEKTVELLRKKEFSERMEQGTRFSAKDNVGYWGKESCSVLSDDHHA